MRRRSWTTALMLLPLLTAPAWGFAADVAETDYEELVAEFETARAAHLRELRARHEAGDTAAVEALREQDPMSAFLPRFQEGAKEHAGAEPAVPFLAWIAQNGAAGGGGTKPALEALSTLQTTHVRSEGIAKLVSGMRSTARSLGNEPCFAFLDAVVAGSPHVAIQAEALFSRASLRLAGEASAETKALALADMRRVIELVPGTDGAERAEGAIFQAERLQIGMVAPDIEGEDLHGVPFKLSDYRGKVVVIDFWGDW